MDLIYVKTCVMDGNVELYSMDGNLPQDQIDTLKVGDTLQTIKLTANSSEKTVPLQTYRILAIEHLKNKSDVPYIQLIVNRISW